MGHFMVHTPERSVLYVCTKFEADSSIILYSFKSYKGVQKIEIGSRDPGHAQLGVILWPTRQRGPSSMSVPNLTRIAQFVQKLLRGPKIWKLGHVTRATPT